MKYCVIKDTTKVIDGSENPLDTMLQNAQNAGFTEDEVDILTEEEYLARRELESISEIPLTEEQQRLLDLEMAMAAILGGGM